MIILTAGKYGEAVANRLAQLTTVKKAPLTGNPENLELLIKNASSVAVASWRPYVDAYELIDELCFKYKKPWMLADIHGQRLTCGPVIVPGRSACFSCYHKRYLTQHRAPERELVMSNAYHRDAALGIEGFCNAMVEIGAAALFEQVDSDYSDAGCLRCVDVIGGTVLESKVIGIHSCKKCGVKRTTDSSYRFVEKIVPAIKEILV